MSDTFVTPLCKIILNFLGVNLTLFTKKVAKRHDLLLGPFRYARVLVFNPRLSLISVHLTSTVAGENFALLELYLFVCRYE